ncbi:MAG TPA: DUF3127 domain-containing protein [Bacteroidales bacterium]|nr:DUF3127 domain-containing protein [Bacteroidales bacterium]
MSFEITGTLIEKYETTEISSKFKKREFVLEKKENSNGFEFTDYIKFQLTQDKCALLDSYNPGQELKVNFNLRGRKWEKDGKVSYFTNLEAWKIESLASGSDNSSANIPGEDIPLPGEEDFSSPDQEFDDLPF